MHSHYSPEQGGNNSRRPVHNGKGDDRCNGKGEGKHDRPGFQKKGKGKEKGKVGGKRHQKSPEEKGFELKTGGLYVRAAGNPLKHVLPCGPNLEIGNQDRPDPGEQPAEGSAMIEVLCTRQSLLGNPWSIFIKRSAEQPAQHALHQDNREELRASCPAESPMDESLRDPACNAYESFLERILDPDTKGTLGDVALDIARSHNLPESMFAKEWMNKFGHAFSNELRHSFERLHELVEARRSSGSKEAVRLLCHCVPLRCHCQILCRYLIAGSAGTVEARKIAGKPQGAKMHEDADNSKASASSSPKTDPRYQPNGTAATSYYGWENASQNAAIVPSVSGASSNGAAEVAVNATAVADGSNLPGSKPQEKSGFARRRHHRINVKPWGAAGIIALLRPEPLEGALRNQRVCLVQKRNGRLGFPKGGAEVNDGSAQATAHREWIEETNLPIEGLSALSDETCIVDPWGVHYFPACWTSGLQTESWFIKDDPTDNDPIVSAHWKLVTEALVDPMLSQERRQLLRQALQTLGKDALAVSATTAAVTGQAAGAPAAGLAASGADKTSIASGQEIAGSTASSEQGKRRWNKISKRY